MSVPEPAPAGSKEWLHQRDERIRYDTFTHPGDAKDSTTEAGKAFGEGAGLRTKCMALHDALQSCTNKSLLVLNALQGPVVAHGPAKDYVHTLASTDSLTTLVEGCLGVVLMLHHQLEETEQVLK